MEASCTKDELISFWCEQFASYDAEISSIEETIRMSGDKSMMQKFGTFRLIFPHGRQHDWDNFCSRPLAESFEEILPKCAPAIAIIAYRRHPEEIPYFLYFFDRANQFHIPTRLYISVLCHQIAIIPVQWIVQHVTLVSDIRYAIQLVNAAFAEAIQEIPRALRLTRFKRGIWDKYRTYCPSVPDESSTESWKRLIDYRVAMREIIDFKLDIRLIDYLKFDKLEIVKRIISNCGTPNKLRSLLKNQIAPYCQNNAIDISSFLVSIATKDWPVAQKLLVVEEYVKSPTALKESLQHMTFSCEQDLEKIREFAVKYNIEYGPTPGAVANVLTQKSAQAPLITRSNSIDRLPIKISSSQSFDQYRRSPSIDLGKMQQFIGDDTFMAFADGEPSNPKEYASKLYKFRKVQEIKPLYEIATQYHMSVALYDYTTMFGKRQIFSTLMLNQPIKEFSNICSILQLEPDVVVDIICAGDEYLPDAGELLEHILPYVQRSNGEQFYRFLNRATEDMINHNDPFESVINFYIRGSSYCIDFVNGNYIAHLVQSLRIAELCKSTDGGQKQFSLLINDITRVIDDFPISHIEMTIEEFIKNFNSDDINLFISTITTLATYPQDLAIKYLNMLLPHIPGTKYARIHFVYILLKELDDDHEREINIITVLFNASGHNIDFHKLMVKPMSTLRDNITLLNVFQLLPLANMLEVSTDDLILHLIIAKMNSSNYEDYQPLISRLQIESCLRPLLQHLTQRFSSQDQIQFFTQVGKSDKQHIKEVMFVLMEAALPEFIKEEYLHQPKLLITELYNSLPLQQKKGNKIHSIAKLIAKHYEIDLYEIQEENVRNWLSYPDIDIGVSVGELRRVPSSVFDEQKGNTNLQKALFILRKWQKERATKWLLDFYDSTDDFHAKSMAISCLVTVADESLYPADDFDISDFYFAQYFHEITDLNELNPEFIKARIALDVDDPKILLQYFIDHHIEDPDSIITLVKRLLIVSKRFILTEFIHLFNAIPSLTQNEEVWKLFIEVISSPVAEITMKEEHWKPSKSHHFEVISDVLDALSLSPFPIEYIIVNGEELTWGDAANQLCAMGSSALLAEIGSNIVQTKTRNIILANLLVGNHFDDALSWGYDHEVIFEYIVHYNIETATEVILDQHFIMFTLWLKSKGYRDAIIRVENALKNQGRTNELKRMHERLGEAK